MDIDVSLETPVEDLVEKYPEAVGFLSRHGVRCIRCGEPLWCTLGELLREDDIENPQRLLDELIEYLREK
jgi:methionine synthase II (cobalamin-independent)